MRRIAALRRDDGAVAVETAVTFSVLILLILGIIEFAIAFWQWNTMLLAVGQVGRYVMINNNPALGTTCDASCASGQLQIALNTTCTGTTPAADQTCVSASPSTQNGTSGMVLTAAYGFDFIVLSGAFTLTSATWVPLD